MDENAGFFSELTRGIMASSALAAAGWGALGGATAALTVQVTRKAAIRMVVLGSIAAGGVGSLSMAAIAKLTGIPAELIPVAGAASSASYLVGVFGPAVIEVLLSRIRAGRLPGEGGGGNGNS